MVKMVTFMLYCTTIPTGVGIQKRIPTLPLGKKKNASWILTCYVRLAQA